MNVQMREQIRRITITAIFLALLIVGQLVFGLIGAPLSQYFVGSWVNLILALAAIVLGWPYGLALGVISPFVALLVGIAPPFIEIIPLIALANGIFAITLHFIYKIKATANIKVVLGFISVAIAALIKTGVMYLTIVILLLPTLPLNATQITLLSAVYSINQLPTALIGGLLAMMTAIPVTKALKYRYGGHA